MTIYLRYISLALAVFVAAVVFVACGDMACGEAIHPCCVKSDRADRLRTDTGQALATCVLRGAAASALTKWFPRAQPHIALAALTLEPPLALTASPLRL